MTEQDKQHFEGLLVKAVQAGKQETSGLVDMIMHEIKSRDEARDAKINALDEKFEAFTIRAEPVLKMGENVEGFGKVSLYILGFFASVSGVVFSIIHFIKEK